jgi:hypothetical protein
MNRFPLKKKQHSEPGQKRQTHDVLFIEKSKFYQGSFLLIVFQVALLNPTIILSFPSFEFV